jgi:CheY-like chemotaxis protein
VNLVGNAIKFTEAGEVVVEVRLASRSDTTVDVAVAVRDTGIGIPPEQQQRIFNAFDQADTSTTRHYGGTGLGLAITSQLVGLMGGHIGVESEVGAGSAFSFTLVFAVPQTGGADVPASPQSLRDLPVLVVDDNQTNRHILEEMLLNWGMQPTVVADGLSALAELERAAHAQRGYPLALLDVMMPEMDGYTLAIQIRQHQTLAGVRLLMLSSAAGHPNDESRMRELGIARCLLKPVKQADLLQVMTETLGIATGDAVSPQSITTPRPKDIFSRHILLAEDGLVNQKVAVDMLTQRGHTVVVASNGKEALDAWEREAFDLVLMDVQMPAMDGFETTAAIRAKEHATGVHMPIIAMTAAAMQGDRERCLEAGMDGYIAKPIRAADLYQAVEEMTLHSTEPQAQAETTVAETTTLLDTREEVEPPLDWGKALARLDGNAMLLQEIAVLFCEEGPRLMTGIREAIAQGETAELRRVAHTLKGSADMFAAQPAVKTALRLETLARDGDLTHLEDAYWALEDTMARLLPVIRDMAKIDGT